MRNHRINIFILIFLTTFLSCETTVEDQFGGAASTEAIIEINKTSHDFGTISYGTSDSVDIIISNNSLNSTETCSSVTLTGDGSSYYSIESDTCSDEIVAAGDSCTIKIKAAPIKVGYHPAKISYSCDTGLSTESFEVNFTMTGSHSADAGNSSVIATSTADADGSNSNIQVTLKDASNNPVWGVTPTITLDEYAHAFSIGTCSETNSSGVSTCTVNTGRPGNYNLKIATPVVVTGGALNVSCPAGGISSTILENGSGTVGSPYEVNSLYDLEHLRCHTAGDYFKLTTDIDLDNIKWIPMELSGGTGFQASLDGDNHKIENFSFTSTADIQGFFTQVTSGNTIQKLTLHNPYVISSHQQVGVLAGILDNVTLSDVQITSDYTNPILDATGVIGAKMVGGLTAFFNNGTDATNVSVTGNIKFSGSVGAGFMFGGVVARIGTGGSNNSNLSYTGTITQVGANSSIRVGGIVGSMQSSTISGCTSNATINTQGGLQKAGGVVGYIASSTLNNCNSTSTINVGGNATEVGGVIGHQNAGNINTNTFNGTITVSGSGSGVGGIHGKLYRGRVHSSSSQGTINAGSVLNVGGIAGSFDRALSSSYNLSSTMNVTGNSNVGGIFGYVGAGHNPTILDDISYDGTVLGNGDRVGGLAGNMGIWNATASTLTIGKISTAGSVTSNGSNVGGIIGTTAVPATITNVVSTSSLQADHTLGGLVGELDATSSIDYGLFFGTYTLNTATAFYGGIVGNNSGTINANVYWDNTKAAFGQRDDSGSASGLLSTAQSQASGNYSAGFQAEFTAGTTWDSPSAGTYPALAD